MDHIVRRIRRNHGLEHATIHVLSARHKNFSAQANSDHRGFRLNIYGDIGEDQVREAVQQAYARMKGGEAHLAVHPNCGTALLTTATMATLAAQAAVVFEQRRQRATDRNWTILLSSIPSAILAVVVSIIVSRPLGLQLQHHFTTEGDLGELEVVGIRRVPPSPVTRLFKLLLAGGRRLPTSSYQVTTRGG